MIYFLLYIKITSLTNITYYRKRKVAIKFCLFIKYYNNILELHNLLKSINDQTITLVNDIYLLTSKIDDELKALCQKYQVKIILKEDISFFTYLRRLNNYDGYFIFNSYSTLNKNYFKDMKKDIKANYDIIYTNNSYYITSNILVDNISPYLEEEKELKYYSIYYDLKTTYNNTLVYGKSLKESYQNTIKSKKKYYKYIKKSLKYKLPNHYARFKLCYINKSYLCIISGILLIIISMI